MDKLTREDLWSLEEYEAKRNEFRTMLIRHKRNRQVPIGPNATLYFEDRLTIKYQIQEMLRVEKIFQMDAIQEELDTYNSLIPDGDNWKATFMLEFADASDREAALQRLTDIENSVWIQVDRLPRICAIADEDLERTTDEKTSAVHFLRFQLMPEQIRAARSRHSSTQIGIDHERYRYIVDRLPKAIQNALRRDLDET